MENKGKELDIRGVRLYELARFDDERGSFMEMFRMPWLPESASKMVQANLSVSRKGVVRGLHYHLKQADYWSVMTGTLRAAMVDLRVGSPTRGNSLTVDLDESSPRTLYVPPGVAHGYQALTDATLVYLVDQLYDGSDEHGLRWDDPELEIGWSRRTAPILSPRDQANPPLAGIPRDRLPTF